MVRPAPRTLRGGPRSSPRPDQAKPPMEGNALSPVSAYAHFGQSRPWRRRARLRSVQRAVIRSAQRFFHARFRYQPGSAAGRRSRSISWNFASSYSSRAQQNYI